MVLVLPVDLTRAEATACLQMLVQGLDAEPEALVLVDAGALLRFDSAALAVLLEFRREALAIGKTLGIRAMPARLHDLAMVYGIAELLPAA